MSSHSKYLYPRPIRGTIKKGPKYLKCLEGLRDFNEMHMVDPFSQKIVRIGVGSIHDTAPLEVQWGRHVSRSDYLDDEG